MFEFIIPVEPTPKQSVKVDFKRKRTYQPAKFRRYTKRIHEAIQLQLGKQSFPKELIDSPLQCDIDFYILRPESAKKRRYPHTRPDLGNLEKPICDALEGILITNDSRIVDLNLRKRYAEKSPCVIVRLCVLS